MITQIITDEGSVSQIARKSQVMTIDSTHYYMSIFSHYLIA
jgi:hypothetical protein